MIKQENLKKIFLKKYYNEGDLCAFDILDTLKSDCVYELKKELEEILPILYKLNYLQSECENGTYNKKISKLLNNSNIGNLYVDLTSVLFDILKITSEDLKKYN